MMNGQIIVNATSLERGDTLAAVADAPFLDSAGKVETLFLATLGRRPRPEELARLVAFVDQNQSAPESTFVKLAAKLVAGVNRVEPADTQETAWPTSSGSC